MVVKLDVEGAEADAMLGAKPVMRDLLIIYEDRGSDPSHRATRAALDRDLVVTYFADGSHNSAGRTREVKLVSVQRSDASGWYTRILDEFFLQG